MNKVMRYFVWNVLIMGVLALGYFLNEQNMTGLIVGIYYGIAVALYFVILIFNNKDIRKMLVKVLSKYEYWKLPFEVLFLVATIKMGYIKIGIAMFFEVACLLYLHFNVIEWNKEENQEATN